MQRHMPQQVALVAESFLAFRTGVGFFFRWWSHILGIVVQVHVSLEELLLSECLGNERGEMYNSSLGDFILCIIQVIMEVIMQTNN